MPAAVRSPSTLCTDCTERLGTLLGERAVHALRVGVREPVEHREHQGAAASRAGHEIAPLLVGLGHAPTVTLIVN